MSDSEYVVAPGDWKARPEPDRQKVLRVLAAFDWAHPVALTSLAAVVVPDPPAEQL